MWTVVNLEVTSFLFQSQCSMPRHPNCQLFTDDFTFEQYGLFCPTCLASTPPESNHPSRNEGKLVPTLGALPWCSNLLHHISLLKSLKSRCSQFSYCFHGVGVDDRCPNYNLTAMSDSDNSEIFESEVWSLKLDCSHQWYVKQMANCW